MAVDRRAVIARLATVRARTTLLATVVVGAALAVGSVVLVLLLRRSLISNLDQAVVLRARDVAAQAKQGDLPPALAVAGEEQSLVQVIRAGRVVASSANLRGQPPLAALAPSGGRQVVVTRDHLPVGERRPYRVAAVGADTARGRVIVLVAVSLEQVEGSTSTVEQILVAGTPALVVLVAATTWFVLGRALRPVESIRSRVADISDSALGQRVPEPSSDDEIGRLARTMNDMLNRLETSAGRQRRFVGDASHELRSPLATSRAELEVALAHIDATDWPATARELLQETLRMEELVRNLLLLARSDGTQSAAPSRAVDLDDVVLSEVARVRQSSGIEVDARAVSAASVLGRVDDLARVVQNLLDNAVRHAASRVKVSLTTDGDHVLFRVHDDGP
ncbi:MAG: HAMP domain-containing histidine kinase, partial [Actinomycetota bacterium]|nr:HAMP domain-containing histidine kinase [Actinomycetota bacterium]